MEEMENPPNLADVIREEIPVNGFIVFELTYAGNVAGKLVELLRTQDIIMATGVAESSARGFPGIKFYIYSGITGKWYAYYKPIQGV